MSPLVRWAGGLSCVWGCVWKVRESTPLLHGVWPISREDAGSVQVRNTVIWNFNISARSAPYISEYAA